jgi:hypothetical protein
LWIHCPLLWRQSSYCKNFCNCILILSFAHHEAKRLWILVYCSCGCHLTANKYLWTSWSWMLSSKCDYFCAATGKDRTWERTPLSGKKIMQKNLTIMGSWEVMQHWTH